jgi:hypothetical protein
MAVFSPAVPVPVGRRVGVANHSAAVAVTQYSIWSGVVPPSAGMSQQADTGAYTLGTTFDLSGAVTAVAVRFYFGAGWAVAGTPSEVAIYEYVSHNLVTSAVVGAVAVAGWNDVAITATALDPAKRYLTCALYPLGRYAAEGGYFANPVSSPPLTAPADGATVDNGRFNSGLTLTFPASAVNKTSYFVDVLVQ